VAQEHFATQPTVFVKVQPDMLWRRGAQPPGAQVEIVRLAGVAPLNPRERASLMLMISACMVGATSGFYAEADAEVAALDDAGRQARVLELIGSAISPGPKPHKPALRLVLGGKD